MERGGGAIGSHWNVKGMKDKALGVPCYKRRYGAIVGRLRLREEISITVSKDKLTLQLHQSTNQSQAFHQ